jgi:hypothetical protein
VLVSTLSFLYNERIPASQSAVPSLQPPTLENMSRDCTREVAQFRGYWDHFIDKVTKEKSPRTGRMLRKHHKPTYNQQRMERYFAFLDEQLAQPEMQFRSHMRKAFEIAAQQRPAYRQFIEAGGTVLKDFASIDTLNKLLDDHLVLCVASRLAISQKAITAADAWALIDEPYACLLLAELYIATPKDKHFGGLRLFCAHCHVLDGGKNEVVAYVVQYVEDNFNKRELNKLKRILIQELEDAAASITTSPPGMDHDGYHQCEIWLSPVIDMCDSDIEWETLLQLAKRFCLLLTRYRRKHEPAMLADLLRKCLPLG